MVNAATSATVYEPVPYWAKLPHPMFFKEATSVAVDSNDNVYVFNRGDHPVIIFDKDGNFLETWGAGEFVRPHGITIDAEDNLYLADDDAHMVEKRTKEGKLIFRLGEKGKAAAWQEGDPFNRPTNVAVNPATGDLFVSDGYGNSRVHKYDTDGNYIKSWGEPGSMPGQFSLPHNISMNGTDKVTVADRENFRLQTFTTDGEFVKQIHLHRPMALSTGRGDDTNLFVAEAGPPPVQEGVRRLGRRVVVLDLEGNEITRFGNELGGEGHDQFIAPHGISVDSAGSVYVAEVSYTAFGSQQDPVREVTSLRKWKRVSG
jgi:DNA-binding beta-propeller fold protein YncE